jgi:D-beta-D-heptose 7-phosphate kinase/D-beta-D-heptose 1-phosphate adenosyltransferase
MQATRPRIVIASGGFDPIHEGHIYYLTQAKALGDMLVVALNSDIWLARKKGMIFMTWEERAPIVRALRCVDEVIAINDSDGSARDAIQQVKSRYPDSTIIFANGGDRTATNIPEMDQPDVVFEFGVGGDWKANSSSSVLRRYAESVRSTAESESSPYRRFT